MAFSAELVCSFVLFSFFFSFFFFSCFFSFFRSGHPFPSAREESLGRGRASRKEEDSFSLHGGDAAIRKGKGFLFSFEHFRSNQFTVNSQAIDELFEPRFKRGDDRHPCTTHSRLLQGASSPYRMTRAKGRLPVIVTEEGDDHTATEKGRRFVTPFGEQDELPLVVLYTLNRSDKTKSGNSVLVVSLLFLCRSASLSLSFSLSAQRCSLDRRSKRGCTRAGAFVPFPFSSTSGQTPRWAYSGSRSRRLRRCFTGEETAPAPLVVGMVAGAVGPV
mmetsp:Transcript_43119/g.111767  ORF Transcript_43119/g.111767 Transcript_43119/m.111767 type:complete len:274 (+) Transcript_43119:668-1489(+)